MAKLKNAAKSIVDGSESAPGWSDVVDNLRQRSDSTMLCLEEIREELREVRRHREALEASRLAAEATQVEMKIAILNLQRQLTSELVSSQESRQSGQNRGGSQIPATVDHVASDSSTLRRREFNSRQDGEQKQTEATGLAKCFGWSFPAIIMTTIFVSSSSHAFPSMLGFFGFSSSSDDDPRLLISQQTRMIRAANMTSRSRHRLPKR